jgi:uncharacterized phiE125 gp8 family phage protein
MSLQLITPPAVEPVTLAEAKAHLKVDATDDDSLITSLIAAARAKAEWHTGRAFVTQSWVLWLDRWPSGGADDGLPPALSSTPPLPIEIPLPPLQAVTSITTYALNDAASVLDAGAYQVDGVSEPARVTLKFGVTPPVGLRAINAVAVAFTAGYGDGESDVPFAVKQAILEIVADIYTNRGEIAGATPLGAQALLAPYRMVKL